MTFFDVHLPAIHEGNKLGEAADVDVGEEDDRLLVGVSQSHQDRVKVRGEGSKNHLVRHHLQNLFDQTFKQSRDERTWPTSQASTTSAKSSVW